MTNKKPLILVSNDDGVSAKGIKKLIDIVRPFGEVIVVASEKSVSGQSHAITIKTPLRVEKLHDEKDLKIYATNGTPVDSVKVALNQILDRKPDFLASGINHGSNSSISAIYSGTVGAAMEGCFNGIPSIAFSLLNHSPFADFTTAGKYSEIIFKEFFKHKVPYGTCLNVNIPDVKPEEIKGIKPCRMTKGLWKEEYDKRKDPHGGDYYWLTGSFHNHEPKENNTDEWALQNNYVAIVPLQFDLTSYTTLNNIKKWGI